MLKKIVFAICVLSGFYSVHADYKQSCFKQGADASVSYRDNVLYPYNAIHGEKEWAQLSEEEKNQQKIRNICMGTMLDLHLNCAIYECLRSEDKGLFTPISLNRNITGDEICDILNGTDCEKDDVSELKNKMHKVGGVVADLFLFDMDTVTSEIKSGQTDTGRIDANKEVCYSVDSNGDTVWHALLYVDSGAFENWADLCLSVVGDENMHFLFNAAFFEEDKSGETPLGVAVRENKTKWFSIFSHYIKQEKINCVELAQYSGVSQSSLKDVCQ